MAATTPASNISAPTQLRGPPPKRRYEYVSIFVWSTWVRAADQRTMRDQQEFSSDRAWINFSIEYRF